MTNETDTSASGETGQQGERLQKVLAQAGHGSRRGIETLIADGRVEVNGHKAVLGTRITAEDSVALDGKTLNLSSLERPERRVIVYNKPEGEVTTRNDPEGRPTVFQRLPKLQGQRWIAVGRLDINTTGLMLFTTDGELANRLMHPSWEVDREYAVRIFGEVDEDMLNRLLSGVQLEDGAGRFSDVVHAGGKGLNNWFHVAIMEGRNREVRRLWESQGVQVSRLKRVRYGPVFLPSRLSVGRWEELKQADVDTLSETVGLESVPVTAKTPEEEHQFRRKKQKKGPRPGQKLKPAEKGRPGGRRRRSDR